MYLRLSAWRRRSLPPQARSRRYLRSLPALGWLPASALPSPAHGDCRRTLGEREASHRLAEAAGERSGGVGGGGPGSRSAVVGARAGLGWASFWLVRWRRGTGVASPARYLVF